MLLRSDYKSPDAAASPERAAETTAVLDALKRVQHHSLSFIKDTRKAGDTVVELLKCFVNPNRLIAKRADKKLDFETSKRKYQVKNLE